MLEVNAGVVKDMYRDVYGNICSRLGVPAGELHLHGTTLIEDTGKPDANGKGARSARSRSCLPRRCRSCWQAAIARLTSFRQSRMELFGAVNRAGRARSRSATGSTGKFNTVINSRDLPRRH